jgi:rhodanese-related sulfurtransferase
VVHDLPPKHCFDIREADPSVVHLDVRDVAEFATGHPRGAYNVPIRFRDGGRDDPNPEFLAVARLLAPDLRQRVVVSCGGGSRARRACDALREAGYEVVIHMLGGFKGARREGELVEQGWALAGLPAEEGEGEERGWCALRDRLP